MDTFKKASDELGSHILAFCYFFCKFVINATMLSIYRLFAIRNEEITLHHAERYLVCTTLTLISLIVISQYFASIGWVVIFFGNLRILQILSINLMTILFDFTPTGNKSAYAQRTRWHFLALIFSLCDILLNFGFMYQFFDLRFNILNQHFTEFFSYLYFALETMATIGYGDVVPISVYSKILVAYQIVVDLFMIIFILSGVVGRFQKYSFDRHDAHETGS